MVTNFEEQTKPLSEEELKLVPYLIKGFKDKTKDRPIKANDIISKFNAFVDEINPNNKTHLRKINEVLLRRLINHIRTHSLMPILASSKGYYVSYDKNEITAQIKSLNERANSIYSCSNGLSKFL